MKILSTYSIITEEVSLQTLDPLFYKKIPEELLNKFRSPKKKGSFTLGRAAAFKFLEKLKVNPEIIKQDADGVPLFSPPVKGSISHKEDRAICAGTLSPSVLSIGVDLEIIKPIKPTLIKKIATEDEQTRIDPENSISVLTLFSLKEAIYKAIFPLIKMPLTFTDAEIMLTPQPKLVSLNAAEIPLSSVYLASKALDGYIFSYCIVTQS